MDFEFPESVETIDKVPETFRSLYVQGENGFNLNAEFKGVATAVTGLNTALRASRAEARDAKGRAIDLTPLKEFGASPAEILENFNTQLTALNDKAAQSKGIDPEKIRADLSKGFDKEREQLTTRNNALQGQLYKLLVENAATNAIVEAKGVPELLMPFVQRQTKTVEEDNEFKVYVTDPQGDVRYSGVTGQPMTVKELVNEMKADQRFGRLFESESASGGGTPPASGSRRPAPAGRELTPNEKISQGLSRRRT